MNQTVTSINVGEPQKVTNQLNQEVSLFPIDITVEEEKDGGLVEYEMTGKLVIKKKTVLVEKSAQCWV